VFGSQGEEDEGVGMNGDENRTLDGEYDDGNLSRRPSARSHRRYAVVVGVIWRQRFVLEFMFFQDGKYYESHLSRRPSVTGFHAIVRASAVISTFCQCINLEYVSFHLV